MNTYNSYDFNSDTQFEPMKCCEGGCSISEVKNVVDNAANKTNHLLHDLNCHVAHAENHILDEIHYHAGHNHCHSHCGPKPFEGVATKDDVVEAVDYISEKIDEKFSKFDEVNFFEGFSDLNKQIKEVLDKYGE